jgi:putative membrane protein insertion efficiency factor
VTRLLVALVRLYQLTFAAWLGGHCRFTPSCSVYAIGALRTHGAWRGQRAAAHRVLRCSPLCAGGHDPVPPLSQGFACPTRHAPLVEPDSV